jgi:cob(I)alamin adenosyltransferase
MKIYTRTGDDGTTGLFGGGRVRKDDLRVEAYGAVDEANAAIGLARGLGVESDLDKLLANVQHALFDVGADLATPADAAARSHLRPPDEADVGELEAAIDRYEAELEPLRQFILPAGHAASAALHVARAVARRAERATVALAAIEPVAAPTLRYLNRLSDLLFVLARVMNARSGVSEARFHVVRRSPGDAG